MISGNCFCMSSYYLHIVSLVNFLCVTMNACHVRTLHLQICAGTKLCTLSEYGVRTASCICGYRIEPRNIHRHTCTCGSKDHDLQDTEKVVMCFSRVTSRYRVKYLAIALL